MKTPLVAAAVVGIFLVVVGLVMGQAYRKARVPWLPLPDCGGAVYVAPASVPAEVLAQHLKAAKMALLAKADFKPEVVAKAAAQARVFVVDGTSWTDEYRRSVSGEAVGPTLYVLRDLVALEHELAHACEWVENGTPDETHQSWARRGIWEADSAYRVAVGL